MQDGLPVTLCDGCSSSNGKFDVGDGECSSGVRSEVEDMETLGVGPWPVCVKRARAPSVQLLGKMTSATMPAPRLVYVK